MILEHAVFRIKPGRKQAFEAALAEAVQFIAASNGFQGLEFRASVEKPSTYHLLVRWATVEDHTLGFRESELFAKWRALIGPFFESPPEVEHFTAPLVTKP